MLMAMSEEFHLDISREGVDAGGHVWHVRIVYIATTQNVTETKK